MLNRRNILMAFTAISASLMLPSLALAEGLKIGFSQVTLQSPFYVQLKEGAEAAAKASGNTLVFLDANGDVCQSAFKRNPLSASKKYPSFRLQRLACAGPELSI